MKKRVLIAGVSALALIGAFALVDQGSGVATPVAAGTLAAASGFGLIRAASAADGTGGAMPAMFGHHRRGGLARLCGPERAERVEDAIAVAERRLAITEPQRPAWTALADEIRRGSTTLGRACEAFVATDAGTDAPARFARAETAMATGLEVVRAVRPRFDTLHAMLDDGQKATLDRLMARRHHR